MSTFNNGFIQSGDGNISEPFVLGRAGQSVQVGGYFAPPIEPRNICILGDSTAVRNSTIVPGSYIAYENNGPMAWASCFLGWCWDWEPSDNFAVSGYTTANVIDKELPLMLAAHATRRYERAFISVGTNDTYGGATIAQVKSNLMTLFNTLRSVGIIPVHLGIKPRGADATMIGYKQNNMAINEWLYSLSITGLIEYIDNNEAYADNSTAFGNSLTSLMPDNLHQNNAGAQLEGKLIADYYKAKGYVPNIKYATSQADKFDRANNPNGILFNNANPLLQGGTTAPTNMITQGGTWSKVSRTLPNGQTRSDPTVAALLNSTLHQLYAFRVASANWLSTDPQPGEIIQSRSKIVVVGGANISSNQLSITENNGSGNFLSYCLRMGTSPVPLLVGDYTLYLKTPKIAIRDYAGSGVCSIYSNQELSTLTSATGAFTIQAHEPRIIN
jgi:lysophospholipase L1-like esterase